MRGPSIGCSPGKASRAPAAGWFALAHERACKAELTDLLEQRLDASELPDLIAPRERFAPVPGDLLSVAVALARLARYDEIAASAREPPNEGRDVHRDAARVELILSKLRLPGVKAVWQDFAAQADKEGWPARFLAALAEHEMVERDRRAASNVICWKPDCRPARPSTASISTRRADGQQGAGHGARRRRRLDR